MTFDEDYFRGAEKALMELFRATRPKLMAHHGKIEYETKEDESVVTRLDRDLENDIKETLRRYDPAIGFHGEEYGREGSGETYWLIDPIDGTESLIRGLSSCRNIVTFIDKNQPLYALAYRFTTDDVFRASKDTPTQKNGVKVQLSDRPLNRAWVEFNVNMRLPEGDKIYQTIRPHVAGITVHLDFLNILEGALEGLVVYKSPGSIWDYAPRALLIKRAGGIVKNLGSDHYEIQDNDLLATTPVIFDQVERLLESL